MLFIKINTLRYNHILQKQSIKRLLRNLLFFTKKWEINWSYQELSSSWSSSLRMPHNNIDMLFWFLPLFSGINVIKSLWGQREYLETSLRITKCFIFIIFKIQIPSFIDLSSIPWIHVWCCFVNNQYPIFPENSPGKAHQLLLSNAKVRSIFC